MKYTSWNDTKEIILGEGKNSNIKSLHNVCIHLCNILDMKSRFLVQGFEE